MRFANPLCGSFTLTSCGAVWLWKADYRKQENDIVTDPIRCRKSPPPGFKPPTFKPADTPTIMLQEPCLQGILPSHSLSCLGCKGLAFAWVAAAKNQFFTLWIFSRTALMKLRQAWRCKKIRLQKMIFPHTALMKLRQARLCKKQFFRLLKNYFFSHASCHICQLHLVL